nr:MAG TPA: hypothetical protein [Caudoviricetes sp.]
MRLGWVAAVAVQAVLPLPAMAAVLFWVAADRCMGCSFPGPLGRFWGVFSGWLACSTGLEPFGLQRRGERPSCGCWTVWLGRRPAGR